MQKAVPCNLKEGATMLGGSLDGRGFGEERIHVARQAHLSMEFSRQEHWSRLPYPSPEDLPDPRTQPWPPALQADSSPFELREVLLTGSTRIQTKKLMFQHKIKNVIKKKIKEEAK